ncbi:hypothetical protein V8E36_001267, partial [Tilletia maclaganii]
MQHPPSLFPHCSHHPPDALPQDVRMVTPRPASSAPHPDLCCLPAHRWSSHPHDPSALCIAVHAPVTQLPTLAEFELATLALQVALLLAHPPRPTGQHIHMPRIECPPALPGPQLRVIKTASGNHNPRSGTSDSRTAVPVTTAPSQAQHSAFPQTTPWRSQITHLIKRQLTRCRAPQRSCQLCPLSRQRRPHRRCRRARRRTCRLDRLGTCLREPAPARIPCCQQAEDHVHRSTGHRRTTMRFSDDNVPSTICVSPYHTGSSGFVTDTDESIRRWHLHCC